MDQKTSSDLAEEYYDSESAFKYYTIMHSSIDYTGIASYPEQVIEKDKDGNEYIRGSGIENIKEANIIRDNKMLKLIMDNIPSDRKIKALELGSGRGGLTRFIAKELLKQDKLKLLVGSNISEKENETNRARAKEEGIPEDVYRVDHVSFDDMPYADGEFDLIFSNDSFLHSSNKPKCLARISQILSSGGAFVFTDILESVTAKKEELQDVYARLSLDSLGDYITYDKVLTSNGLKKIFSESTPSPI